MQKVQANHFKHYLCPFAIKASGQGCVAFMAKQANLVGNCYNTNLWLLQNQTPMQLTHSGNIQQFWWKGEQLVFSALRTEQDLQQSQAGMPLTVLHTLPLNAGEAREWLRLPHNVTELCFLPGENEFLFVAEYDPVVQSILDTSPDVASALAAFAENTCCDVATELPAFANGEGPVSGKRKRLYWYQNGTITPLVDEYTDVEHLVVHPGGGSAFFLACRFTGTRPYANQLMEVTLATGALQNLSIQPNFMHDAFALLQDGTLLLMGTDMQSFGIHQNRDFYRVQPETGSHTLLAQNSQYQNFDAVLSDIKQSDEARLVAEEDRVYWLATCQESSHIMAIDINEGIVQQTTSLPGCVMEITLAAQTLYYTAMRGQNGPEVYCLAPDEPEVQISNFNTHLAKQYTLAAPQRFCYQNAEDSTVAGFLLAPPDLDETQSYPAILYIHGGPEMVYGDVLYHEFQYLAALGFAVVYCNPTGSGGRGNEFGDIRGRYGLIDADDVLGFLQLVLAQTPWIDDKRLGIAGGSYGGYLTNWILGQTGQFAAAVSQRGIANWATMATLSDIGYFFVPDQTGAALLEDAEILWEQSPLRNAGKITTPTLFIHSLQDYRCHHAESLQMYAALQTAKVPAKLCLFHNENHNLSRSGKPASRLRRLQEIAAWFTTWLQPGPAFNE